jgi:adenosylcobinamide-phosphate synthase
MIELCHSFEDFIIILGLALVIDLLGEPPERIHPTVIIGKLILFLYNLTNKRFLKHKKMVGTLIGLFVIIVVSIPVYFILCLLKGILWEFYIILSAFLLKSSFSIKAMHTFTLPIAKEIIKGNLGKARNLLMHVVRRDTRNLDEQKILSATVETIAEGTVDGVLSPLFYYSIFGVVGAITFRAINTLDSMLGYEDEEFKDIGWFSAKIDSVANFLPARMNGLLTVTSAFILRLDFKNSWKILLRDHAKTKSWNAGWSFSAFAGALRVRLEKIGHYVIGDELKRLEHKDIVRALAIFRSNILLFIIIVVLPIISRVLL